MAPKPFRLLDLVAATDTALPISDAALLRRYDVIGIGDERCWVTGPGLTVVRGAFGSIAADYPPGTPVRYMGHADAPGQRKNGGTHMADKKNEQLAVFPPEANPAAPAGTPPQDDHPAAGSQADRGMVAPAPGDGTHTGETTPQWGPEPGVTAVDRGSDPGVPAFIPDLVGPRTDAEHDAPTAADRADAADDAADRAVAESRAGERAAKRAKGK